VGEDVSITVRSHDPSDMTEVDVIHTVGGETTAEPSEVTGGCAVEPTEIDMKFDRSHSAAGAVDESAKKSAEPVILCLFRLSVVTLCVCVISIMHTHKLTASQL